MQLACIPDLACTVLIEEDALGSHEHSKLQGVLTANVAEAGTKLILCELQVIRGGDGSVIQLLEAQASEVRNQSKCLLDISLGDGI